MGAALPTSQSIASYRGELRPFRGEEVGLRVLDCGHELNSCSSGSRRDADDDSSRQPACNARDHSAVLVMGHSIEDSKHCLQANLGHVFGCSRNAARRLLKQASTVQAAFGSNRTVDEIIISARQEQTDQHDFKFGKARKHHRGTSLEHHSLRDPGLAGISRARKNWSEGAAMNDELKAITITRAFGPVVEGEAVISEEGFSPRCDLDRWPSLITKPGHKLEGVNIRDKICFFPTAKGGIAADWSFFDIKNKGFAPRAFIFGITNPVMVQGTVFANITIPGGWSQHPAQVICTGNWVRVDPARKIIEVWRRAV